MRMLAGGPAPLRALSFSRDRRRIVGAGQDGVIRLWSLEPARTSGI
jgi:WD40 repeat protein